MPHTGSTAKDSGLRRGGSLRRHKRLWPLPCGGTSKYGGLGCPGGMNVAMVTPYWLPVRGGITTFVGDLAETLRKDGHEVLVLAREGGAPGATEIGGTA